MLAPVSDPYDLLHFGCNDSGGRAGPAGPESSGFRIRTSVRGLLVPGSKQA